MGVLGDEVGRILVRLGVVRGRAGTAGQPLVERGQAGRDRPHRGRGDDEDGEETEEDEQRDGDVDGRRGHERGGDDEAEGTAAVGHRLTRVDEARVAGRDVGESGGGEQEEDDADEDAVVAAVVIAAEEEADRVAEEDHRQGERDAAEGAFDDVADHVADRAGDVPPFEGGDDDRESDEEEGGAVALRRRVGGFVTEDLSRTVSGHVGHSPPRTGDNVCPGVFGPRLSGTALRLGGRALSGTRSGGSRSGRHAPHPKVIPGPIPANPEVSAWLEPGLASARSSDLSKVPEARSAVRHGCPT